MRIADVRTLRLGLGTALSLVFSQLVNWPMSFIAPVFTLFLLALPLPAPRWVAGLKFMLMVPVILYLAIGILPLLVRQPLVGLILLVVVLFWSFYFVARGGNAVLGTFATVGIAIATAVGSVSIDAVIAVIQGVSVGTVVGVLFVWVAHALLPDSRANDLPAAPPARPQPRPPDLALAQWSAFRSMVITLPVVLWFLLSSASASYLPVMIKVASMGQQTTGEGTREAGHSLIMSTVIGGALAIVGFQLISVVPNLALYGIFIALTGFYVGRHIFSGAGMAAAGPTWSYGYLTMLIILAPALMDTSTTAGVKFWERILMFAATTLYSVAAVYVFDAFWDRPGRKAEAALTE